MAREKTTCEIKIGHAIDNLRTIPDESIDLVVTSPPYWGLRDYKTEPVVFGGDVECNHDWEESDEKNGWDDQVPQSMNNNDVYADSRDDALIHHQICSKCGAWRGQLGLEQSPELFVEHLVEIFEECRRILKPTGNLWVNLGDSYMRKSNYKAPKDYGLQRHRDEVGHHRPQEIPDGYKRKDLVGLPWLFAFAARRAGWYLRNDIVWAKSISGPHYRGGVCMPEPIKDRCTRSHEFFFHFTKEAKYFYDVEATAEPLADPGNPGRDRTGKAFGGMTRNMRTVWHYNPKPYDGAHFAVYPKHLIEPIVKASTSEHGCCADCGVPWIRVVEHTRIRRNELPEDDPRYRPNQYEGAYQDINGKGDAGYKHTVTTGWRPNCECHGELVRRDVEIAGRLYQGDWKRDAEATSGVAGNHGGNTGLQELAGKWGADSKGEYNGVAQKDYTAHKAEDASAVKSRIIENLTEAKTKTIWVYESDMPLDEHPVKPAVVLDPFSGSGTSGIVALEHGRSYIGIELNPDYAALSERRLKQERTGLTTKKHREAAVSLKEYW